MKVKEERSRKKQRPAMELICKKLRRAQERDEEEAEKPTASRRVQAESPEWAADRRRRTRRRSPQLWLLLTFAVLAGGQPIEGASSASGRQAIESVLLDTTEQSSLGWTRYPEGGQRTHGWMEESFIKFEEPERGINWRSFVVCDVDHASVNNWLWTPFISGGSTSSRLYIEIKFTMRDCNLFPQRVLSCKETFSLLYKEAEGPLGPSELGAANASFAQANDYQLVDTIAADEGRFTSNTDVVINTEVRSVPLTKRGLHFAFRDQGACLSLISIRVYQLHCPELTAHLAHFNATPTGRELSSLVGVEGGCVPNAVQVEPARLFCAPDGQWTAAGGLQAACRCAPGFEEAANATRCQPCPPGRYRWSLQEAACSACPEHSAAGAPGAHECRCLEGYHRAARDPRSAPCTQPPGPPTNLSVVQSDWALLVVQWAAPRQTGGRDDIVYRLTCDGCPESLVSSPALQSNFSETRCVLAGLAPGTAYRLRVEALNGVSALAGTAPAAAELLARTARAPQTPNAGQLPFHSFRALAGGRPTDVVLAWEAPEEPEAALLFELRFQARGQLETAPPRSPYPASLAGAAGEPAGPQTISTTARALALTNLLPNTEYAFQLRAKWAPSAHWSPFSEPLLRLTGSQPAGIEQQQQQQQQFEFGQQQLPQRHAFAPSAPVATPPAQTSTWLPSLAGLLLCGLLALGLAGSVALVNQRKSSCLRSLAGFGQLGAGGTGSNLTGSTYGAVYGSGAGSDLVGGLGPPAHQLISGPNGHAHQRSVVQSLLAATLGQIGQSRAAKASGQQAGVAAATLGHQGRLFAPGRNHYHQTLSGLSHTVLLSPQAGQPEQLKFQRGGQQATGCASLQENNNHIYDDLESAASSTNAGSLKEIEPQRVSIESVLARGELGGQLCTGRLRSALTGAESRVSVRTLDSQAPEQAKLEFLVEALVLSRLSHPNVVQLEALVTRSEPLMIVSELMERGPLDAYLRDNKGRFTCLQLISMLRGVANGMQYLAELNYVHKDLAARNILVNDQNVCKIAHFGLFGQQQQPPPTDIGGGGGGGPSGSGSAGLEQLVSVAERLASARFSALGQQVAGQAKIPVRWTAIEAIAFRHFTSASDVWSFGVLAWEAMSFGERPYWNWTNQDVIKAIEQGYRLPQPENCPEPLYKLMLDCWLKERAGRPTFGQIVKQLDRLLSPYEDPFVSSPDQPTTNLPSGLPGPQINNQQPAPRPSSQEPVYYDTYNPIRLLNQQQQQQQLTLEQWLESIKMSRFRDNFERHQLSSLHYVAQLTQDELGLIGIPPGQSQRRLMAAISALSSSAGQAREGYLV